MDFHKNKLVAYWLLLEEEEDEEMVFVTRKEKRKSADPFFSKRRYEGAFNVTVEKRLFQDEQKLKEYFRVSRELFETILNHINNDIQRKSYNRNSIPISPQEKLCITLRYLATGESFRSLAFQYRIHHSWISVCVKEVVRSIRERMLHVYIPKPSKEQIKHNVEDFYRLWNFPNCWASIDGKHIRIRCPDNAGSLYYNYKNFHSIVLLALVDARCRFVAIDVGSYGREGDAGIFLKSVIRRQIINNQFNIPGPCLLPDTDIEQPNVILGDEAFSLTTYMMKPYPQVQAQGDNTKAVYNYRHSRARRTSENAFGLLCQTFRVFYSPIAVSPDTADNVIIAACIIHNMLRNKAIQIEEIDSVDLPKDNMLSLKPSFQRRASFEASAVRDEFRIYFNSAQGSVHWQNNIISKTT